MSLYEVYSSQRIEVYEYKEYKECKDGVNARVKYIHTSKATFDGTVACLKEETRLKKLPKEDLEKELEFYYTKRKVK